jgi:hypothetical protein
LPHAPPPPLELPLPPLLPHVLPLLLDVPLLPHELPLLLDVPLLPHELPLLEPLLPELVHASAAPESSGAPASVPPPAVAVTNVQ